MNRKKLIIIKIGGSVITQKNKNLKTIKAENLQRICKEIGEAYSKKKIPLIIIHGVGPFGHKLAKEFRLNEGYKDKRQLSALPELHKDVRELNLKIIKALQKNNLPAISFSPSAFWRLEDGRLKKQPTEIIKKYLALGTIPVLHGDLLIDNKKVFSVLSGDQICYYLAKELKSDRVIIGTDLDGVFDSDPKINPAAKLIKKISRENYQKFDIGGSTAIDVTSGMRGKLDELLKLADIGIGSEIINADIPSNIAKILSEKRIEKKTMILPSTTK